MKFIMLKSVKMSIIIGTFNIYWHDKYNICEFESKKFFLILVFMSSWNFMLSWVEHEKGFITLEPGDSCPTLNATMTLLISPKMRLSSSQV